MIDSKKRRLVEFCLLSFVSAEQNGALLHGGKKSPKLMAVIEPFLVGPARHCVREVV